MVKFKTNVLHPDTLGKILQCFLQVNKGVAFVKLGKPRCYIHQKEHDGMEVWCDFFTNHVFSNFRCATNSGGSEIWVELDLKFFHKALNTGTNLQNCVLRLGKVQDLPHLILEYDAMSSEAVAEQRIRVVHNVPVRLLNSADTHNLKTPTFEQQPKVSIYMPGMKEVKPVLDRLKALVGQGGYISLHATMNKTLTFKTQTDNVSISTYFKNMLHPNGPNNTVPTLDKNIQAEAKIGLKHMTKIMAFNAFPNVSVCLNFLDNVLVALITPDVEDVNGQRGFYASLYIPKNLT